MIGVGFLYKGLWVLWGRKVYNSVLGHSARIEYFTATNPSGHYIMEVCGSDAFRTSQGFGVGFVRFRLAREHLFCRFRASLSLRVPSGLGFRV